MPTAQGGVRRYNYGLHFAKVATRELALCVWFCVGYKAKADVRRYNIFLIYAREIAFLGDFYGVGCKVSRHRVPV